MTDEKQIKFILLLMTPEVGEFLSILAEIVKSQDDALTAMGQGQGDRIPIRT